MRKTIATAICVLGTASMAHGAVINSLNTPLAINFDTTVAGANSGQLGVSGDANMRSVDTAGSLTTDTFAVSIQSVTLPTPITDDNNNVSFGGDHTGNGNFMRNAPVDTFFDPTGSTGDVAGNNGTNPIWVGDNGDGTGDIAVLFDGAGSQYNPGAFFVQYVNNTGQSVSAFEFSYLGYIVNSGSRAGDGNTLFDVSAAVDSDPTDTNVDGVNAGFSALSDLSFESDDFVGSGLFSIGVLSTTINQTVAPGESLVIRFALDTNDNSQADIGIDNLTITAVPEPATIGLAGLGAIALLRRRRLA